MDDTGQELILAAIFVIVAIGFGGLATWGFFALNVAAIVIGVMGLVAWFFAGKYILS